MNLNIESIKSILKTSTFRQSFVTFSGTFINGVLGVMFFILSARFLGPSSYGLLTVSIATLTLIADVSDLGVDTGLVRFVSKYSKENNKKAKEFLKLGLIVKFIVGILIIILGFAFTEHISDYIFKKPELFIPLRLSFVGVLGALLFSFTTHVLQAYQKFIKWSLLLITTNAIRLILLMGIFYFGILNIKSSLIIYIFMPILGFVIGLFMIPYFLNAKISINTRKDFFHYNKWIALMTAIAATSSKLDIFISARLLSLDQIGIYSAANQLVQVMPQLVAALGTVIAPKMASMDTFEKMIKYLKKTQLMVGGIAILGLLGIPTAFLAFPLLYGPSYITSIPVFIILLIAMLIFLFSVPIHNSIFYYFSFPKLFFYLAIGHLLIIATTSWFLIGQFGAVGAAFSVLIGAIYNFTIPTIWVLLRVKNGRK